ncbi:MAG TPA: hypothetical protein VK752_18120 [Bryobacteraceae bacterium]|jgi:hypothetical protein|nr:hypothetical protein [Bryobacteraceae bacterium]
MSKNRLILLEFNELCPDLMEQFISQGKLPNFQRLRSQSHVYLTDAGEVSPNLEPWIQWVTVHSGVPFSEHGVFLLGQGAALETKCIWDILSAAKHTVGVCGSMNIRYDRPVNGYVLPDPWSDTEPYPESLMPYVKFVKTNVQEHSNDRVPLSKLDHLKFLAFMQSHGLSVATITSIIRQLMSENGGKNRWKRAVILDKLQFDCFRSYDRKLSPDFSTFFLNSTAHLQHVYWRNLQPELFNVKPSEQEQAEFAAAILFGYQQMDELIGRFLELADDHTTLMFSTALSQQPCLIYEEKGGKVLFRPREFEALMKFAGITAPHSVLPVMAEQFYVHFDLEQDAIAGERMLAALQVDGKPAMILSREGASVFAGCGLFTDQPDSAVLSIADSERAVRFFDVFYKVEGMKSGMHHPDGMLWVRTPEKRHQIHRDKVPLESIAPTILEMFGVTPPSYMKGPLLKDLLPARTMA